MKGLLLSSAPTAPRLIVHAEVPIVTSPSGIPTQHLISRGVGAVSLFVAQQWLQPGDRVLLHTHPVEESITFLCCTAGALHVLFAFPLAEFAETTIVELTPVDG